MGESASTERTERGRQRTRERVPSKHLSARAAGYNMRERGLLNGKKGPYFIAAGAYDSNGTRKNQEQEIAGEGKGHTGGGHQDGPHD